MGNLQYKGKLTADSTKSVGGTKETLSIKLSNPKEKMSEYEKNIFDSLNEMTLTEQLSIAMNSLSKKVNFKYGNNLAFNDKLIDRVKYNSLTLEEIVKLKAYLKTYFGRMDMKCSEYENMSDKMDFVSNLSIDGKLAFITLTYSNVRTPEIENTLLFQLAIPEQLLKSPKMIIAAYFVITNYIQVLLTGEL